VSLWLQSDDWIVGPADGFSRTYSGTVYTAYFYSCCRIAMQGPLSNQYWNVETKLNLNPTPGGWINTSPVSSGVPIVDVYRNALNTWVVPAADNDGDPLSYRLATAAETTRSSAGGNPSGMTMTSSGLIQWTPSTNGLYGTQVIVEDAYSSIAVDYILRVQDPKGSACRAGQPNANPAFISPSPWIDGSLPTCFKPGSSTSFTVRAQDSLDTCDTVYIQSGSLPVGASLSKTGGTNPVSYSFSWNPSTSMAGNHLVCFISYDQQGGTSKQECITLYVPNSGSKIPTISTAAPQRGETSGNTAITVTGTNFERGSGLYCRFTIQSVSTKVLRQAVYVSTGEVVCVTPEQPSGAGTRLTLEVSNLASCDEWTTVFSNVDFYYAACPPGSVLSGPTCADCPKGTYQAGGSTGGEGCTPCPAGRYGAETGLKSALCSGICPQGYYCPAQTQGRFDNACPAGTFGSSEGLSSSACSGVAQAGYYTTGGATSATQFPCSSGRWGGSGQTTSQCSGPCSAGYKCAQGSSSSTASECGSAAVYCPEGVSAALVVQSGYYSVGGSSVSTRTSQQICEAGYYCENGERKLCPVGRYGSGTGLSTSDCTGPCKAGFYCPAGSTSATAEECDSGATGNTYCPEGATSKSTVSAGYYSTPLTSPLSQRSGQAICESDYVCASGIRKLKIEWTTGCRAVTDNEAATGAAIGSAPRIELLSLAENGVTGDVELGTIGAVSNQGGGAATVSYSIVSSRVTPTSTCPGVSNIRLTTSSTARKVVLTGPVNYEQCSKFELLVRATAGSYTSDCAVSISVDNMNDSPKTTSSSVSRSVREDSGRNGLVGGPLLDVEVSDEDVGQELKFEITSSNFDIFAIGSCSGQLSLAVDSALDYETRSSYPLTIKVTDDHPTDAKFITLSMTVNVLDVNERPVFVKSPAPLPGSGVALNPSIHFNLTIFENSAAGSLLLADQGALASDPDIPTASSSNTLEYSIVEQDPAIFAIDSASGVLSVSSSVGTASGPAKVDFEDLVGGAITVKIRVRDGLGLFSEASFPISIVDVNDPPVVPAAISSSFSENLGSSVSVTETILGVDEDLPQQPLTFQVVSEQLWVRAVGSWVTTASSGAYAFESVTAPGTSGMGAVVRTSSVSSIATDFERVSSVRLTLRATDSPHAGFPAVSRDTIVTLSVQDVNEQPWFVGHAGSAAAAQVAAASSAPSAGQAYVSPPPAVSTIWLNVSELAPARTLMGTLVAFDPDIVTAQTLFITAQPDASSAAAAALFQVETAGNVTVVASNSLNFEAVSEYSLPIRVTDSGSPAKSANAVLRIRIIDEQEPPVIASNQVFTIPENSAPGTAVTGGAVQASDPDAADVGGLQFSILFGGEGNLTPGKFSNPSQPLFEIHSTTGVIRLSSTAYVPAGMHEDSDLNYERMASTFVTVQVVDTAGNKHVQTVTVRLIDVNERPSNPGRDGLIAVAEKKPSGTVVGTLHATDVDALDVLSFTITGVTPPTVAGASDACNSFNYLAIDSSKGAGTVVLTATSPDRSNGIDDNTNYGFGCNVTFKATDRGGLQSPTGYAWVEFVRNNEPPFFTLLPATVSVPEDKAGGSVLMASLGAQDSSADQVLTHSIRSVRPQAMAAAFQLDSAQPGTLRLRSGFHFDFETNPTVNITVETADDGRPVGLRTSSTIYLVITDVAEAPSISLGSGSVGSGMAVDENSPAGTVVGSLTASDQDFGEVLTFSLTPRGTPASELPFVIDASSGQIRVRAVSAGPAFPALSYESKTSWDVTGTVTDKDGLTASIDFAIAIRDVNEACSASVTPASGSFAVDPSTPGGSAASGWAHVQVSESASPGTTVARIVATDPDNSEHPLGWGRLNYRILASPSLAGGVGEATADAAARTTPYSSAGSAQVFTVTPQGYLVVAAALDWEDQERHDIVVQVLDSDASSPLGVNVTVSVRVVNDQTDTAVTHLAGTTVHPSVGTGSFLLFVGRALGVTSRRTTRSASGADALAPSVTYVASAVAQPGNVVYTSSACAQTVVGVNTELRCELPPGYGTSWVWTVTVTVRYTGDAPTVMWQRAVAVDPATAGTTRVASPVITSVVQGLRSEPTKGGSTLILEGTSFGPLGTPVVVQYGRTTGMELTALSCAVSVAHTRVQCTTVAGVGTGLGVIITIAGQASARYESSSTPLGYAVPSIIGMAVLPQSVDSRTAVDLISLGGFPTALRTTGTAQQIVIQGSNLGAIIGEFSLVFGGGVGVANKYTVSGSSGQCTIVTAHELISCEAPSGQGLNLRVRVVVGAQSSAIAPDDSRTRLWYAPPVVSAVQGQGSEQGATEGQETLVLIGSDFPPVGDVPAPVVRYGPAPDGTLYTAKDCRVTVSGSRIECTTVEGVGFDLSVWLAVLDRDPLAAWTGPGMALPTPAITSAVTYHPPVIMGYSGPGAQGSSTQGGSDWYVDVQGRHFGPATNSKVNTVTYAKPAVSAGTEAGVVFRAQCSVLVSHTVLRCNMSQGAGADLAWNVTIAGQRSVEPVTSYDPPSITGFSGTAGMPPASDRDTGFLLAQAAPDGNQTVVLTGLNFGPPARQYIEWVRFSPASLGNVSTSATYYSASQCRGLTHRSVECVTPPATGGPFFWKIRIKGQTSEVSPAFYFRLPKPLFIEPAKRVGSGSTAPLASEGPGMLLRSTAGGQLVRIVGRWFGLKDPHASFRVRWGGLTLTPSARYQIRVPPTLLAAVEAGNATAWVAPKPLAATSVGEWLDALEVTVPTGFGTGLDIRIVVSSLAGESVSSPGMLSFDYRAPALSFPSVREDTANPLTMMYMLVRGTNLCQPPTPGYVATNGDPPAGSVTSFVNCAKVYLKNLDDPDVAMRDVFRVLGPSEVTSHTHTEIQLHIPRGRGVVRIEVAGRATSELSYEQLAPGLLTGECLRFGDYRFRTQGWTSEDEQLLRVKAFDICNASLTVTVGGMPCTAVTFPPEFVEVDQNTGKRVCQVECRVPPGQGPENEVVVVNGGMASNNAPGNPPCIVAYAPPTIVGAISRLDARGNALDLASTLTIDPLGGSAVTLSGVRRVSRAGVPPPGGFVRPGEVTATPYSAQPSKDVLIVLPTEGGRVLLEGDSFGLTQFSDLTESSFVELRPDGSSRASSRDSPVVLDVSDAVGSFGQSHTLVELWVPSVGTGTGWVLSMAVAGQPVTSYVGVAFEPPVVAAVLPNRVGTTGGQRVRVQGFNFGVYTNRISVTIGGKTCAGLTLVTPHREVECTAPEGAGARAAVVVSVDGQSSGGGVTIDYLPPYVTSVFPSEWLTDGTAIVTVRGSNLGRADGGIPVRIDLLPRSDRSGKDLTRTLPDPDANTQLTHSGKILSHNHTHIVFKAPQIQGLGRTLRVTVVGQTSLQSSSDAGLGSPPEAIVSIQPPVLKSVAPLVGPTAGYLVRFSGQSFGRIEPVPGTTDKSDNRGLLVVAIVPGGNVRLACSSVGTAGGEWSREYASWDFVDPITGEKPPRPLSPYTHSEYFCRLPRGFGQNITLDVSLDGVPAAVESSVSSYSYAPPSVLTLVPNQPSANGRKGVFLQGQNFGSDSFGTARNIPSVFIGKLPCDGAALVSDERIDCDSRRDTAGVKQLVLNAAGYANLTYPDLLAAANGQDVWRVEAVCPILTYGQPGELCMDCPGGGVCEGPVCVIEAPASQAASCVQFIEPYADVGFWKIAQPAQLCPDDRKVRPAPFNGSCPAFLPCDPKEACLGDNVCATGYVGERCGECNPGLYYRRNGKCIECPSNVWLLPALFALLVVVVAGGAYILHRLDAAVSGFGTALFVAVDHMQVLSILAKTRVRWPPFLASILEFLSVFQFNIDLVGLDCAVPNIGYELRWLGTELLPIAFMVLFLLLHCVLWIYKCAVMRQDKLRRNDHISSLISTSILLCYVLYLQVTRTAFDALNCMALNPPDGYTYLEAVFTRCGDPLQSRLAGYAYVFICLYTIGFPLGTVWLLQRHKSAVKVDQILRAMDITSEANGLAEFRRRWSRLYMHFVPGQAPYWILLLIVRKALVALAALIFGRVPSFQLAAIMFILFVAFVLNVRYTPYMSYEKRREVVLQHRAKARAGDDLHKTIAVYYQRAIVDRATRNRARRTGLDAMTGAAGAAAQRRAQLAAAAKWSGDPNRMETILLFVSMLVALTGVLMESGQTEFAYFALQRDLIAYAALVLVVVAVMYAFGVVLFEIVSTFARGANGGCMVRCCDTLLSGGKSSSSKGKKKDGSTFTGSPLRGTKGSSAAAMAMLSSSEGSAAKGMDLESILKDMEDEAALAASAARGETSEAVGFHVNPMAAAAIDIAEAGEDVDKILSSDMVPTETQWALVRKHAESMTSLVTKLTTEAAERRARLSQAKATAAAAPATAALFKMRRGPRKAGRSQRALLAAEEEEES
jgi:hypothetical protein